MKLRELFEALTANQKAYVDDELGKLEYNPAQWNHIFGNQERIFLEMEPILMVDIVGILSNLGYHITDYVAGMASTIKKYNIENVLRGFPSILEKWRNDPYHKRETNSPDQEVLDRLQSMNYAVDSGELYREGVLTKEVTDYISTILSNNKIDEKTMQMYNQIVNSDDYKNAYTTEKSDMLRYVRELDTNLQMVVISRNRYDVAEVGTNKNWSSCLNLGGGWDPVGVRQERGVNAHRVSPDISIGCLAAYLVEKDDLELRDPIARLSIKPFINDTMPGKVALGVHDTVYHRRGKLYPAAFQKSVREWADGINVTAELDGLFTLHPRAYNHNEFKSTEKEFGSYAIDRKTYKDYGDKIEMVPEELRTMGYFRLLLNDGKFNIFKKILRYAKDRTQVAGVIISTIARTNDAVWISYIPDEYVNDSDLIMDIIEASLNYDTILASILAFKLLPTVFDNQRERFLAFFKRFDSNPDNTSAVSDFINALSSDYAEPILLATAPYVTNSGQVYIHSLLNGGNTGDKQVRDAIRRLIKECNVDYTVMSDAFLIIPSLADELTKDIPERAKELTAAAKSASSVGELTAILAKVASMRNLLDGVSSNTQEKNTAVLSPIYDAVAMNDYVNTTVIKEIIDYIDKVPVLMHILETELNVNLLNLIAYRLKKVGGSSNAVNKVRAAWFKIASEDVFLVIKQCNDSEVILKILNDSKYLKTEIIFSALISDIMDGRFVDNIVKLSCTIIEICPRRFFAVFNSAQYYKHISKEDEHKIREHFQDKIHRLIVGKNVANDKPLLDTFSMGQIIPFIKVSDEKSIIGLLQHVGLVVDYMFDLLRLYDQSDKIPSSVESAFTRYIDSRVSQFDISRFAAVYVEMNKKHLGIVKQIISKMTDFYVLHETFPGENEQIRKWKDERLTEANHPKLSKDDIFRLFTLDKDKKMSEGMKSKVKEYIESINDKQRGDLFDRHINHVNMDIAEILIQYENDPYSLMEGYWSNNPELINLIERKMRSIFTKPMSDETIQQVLKLVVRHVTFTNEMLKVFLKNKDVKGNPVANQELSELIHRMCNGFHAVSHDYKNETIDKMWTICNYFNNDSFLVAMILKNTRKYENDTIELDQIKGVVGRNKEVINDVIQDLAAMRVQVTDGGEIIGYTRR